MAWNMSSDMSLPSTDPGIIMAGMHIPALPVSEEIDERNQFVESDPIISSLIDDSNAFSHVGTGTAPTQPAPVGTGTSTGPALPLPFESGIVPSLPSLFGTSTVPALPLPFESGIVSSPPGLFVNHILNQTNPLGWTGNFFGTENTMPEVEQEDEEVSVVFTGTAEQCVEFVKANADTILSFRGGNTGE